VLVPIMVGPTAVGKTAVSIPLAKRLNAEIVSADSRQVYKYMDIGTAKPDPEEIHEIPHHLVDTLDLEEPYTAGRFAEDGRRCIREIFARGKTPMVVGGAGLYIKALLEGLFDEPARDEAVRERLYQRIETEGIEPVYKEFCEIDPDYADQVHPNDVKKIVRAMEIYQVTGKAPSDQFEPDHAGLEYPYRMVGLTRDRAELYDRINRRVEWMISKGLVDEVRTLLEEGYTGEENSLQTVGYREIIRHLHGELSLEEAVSDIQKHTRHYAKRQLTWFRNQHDVQWFHMGEYESREDLVDAIEEYLHE